MKLSPRIVLFLLVPPLMWAGNAVVARMTVGSMPPLLLNALRWDIALCLLLPLGYSALKQPQDLWRRWPYLAVLGFLGMGCYNALQYLALQSSSPLNVTLIAASMPVGMLLLGALCFGEPARPRQWLGAGCSLLGVLTVLTRGDMSAVMRLHFVAGDLLMLLAVLAWAGYSWLLAKPPASMRGAARPAWNWAEFLFVQMLFGVVFGSAAAGLEQLSQPAPVQWSAWLVLALAYVALGPSLLAYRCWALGVATVGPAVAAFFSNLTPVFAALLSGALLGEWPQWFHGLAFVLIAAGIVISSRR